MSSRLIYSVYIKNTQNNLLETNISKVALVEMFQMPTACSQAEERQEHAKPFTNYALHIGFCTF